MSRGPMVLLSPPVHGNRLVPASAPAAVRHSRTAGHGTGSMKPSAGCDSGNAGEYCQYSHHFATVVKARALVRRAPQTYGSSITINISKPYFSIVIRLPGNCCEGTHFGAQWNVGRTSPHAFHIFRAVLPIRFHRASSVSIDRGSRQIRSRSANARFFRASSGRAFA